MKRQLLAILITLLITTLSANDALWGKAQKIAENSWRLVPGKTTIKSGNPEGQTTPQGEDSPFGMEFTGKSSEEIAEAIKAKYPDAVITSSTHSSHSHGQTKSLDDNMKDIHEKNPDAKIDGSSVKSFSSGTAAYEIVLSHKLVNKKEIKTEVVSSNMNIPQLLDAHLNQDMTPKRDNVFLERSRRNVSVKKMNETKTINGKQCQGYDISHTPGGEKKQAVQGTMWLDIATGSPVYSEFTQVENTPPINSMVTKTYYSFDAKKNQFYVTKRETTTDVAIMSIKTQTVTTDLFEDYWEYQL